MPPKRKASAVQPNSNSTNSKQKSSKQLKQDGQRAVSRDLEIPVDEGFAGSTKSRAATAVYIDDDSIIYDASLNQSNVTANNNKFYRIQVVVAGSGKKAKYSTFNRWGRVGEFGQCKHLEWASRDDAVNDFETKFKSKTGNAWEDRDGPAKKGKYTFIQRNYEKDEDDDVKKESSDENADSKKSDVESKLPRQVQRLVELIFNENHFNSVLENIGYNNDKLPLGKLGQSTIKKGFSHLQELSSLIRHPSLARNKYGVTQQEAIEDQTNSYYSTIPHVFGRTRPPLIDNNDILQRETAMLDTLTDMEIASKIMRTTSDRHRDSESVSLIDKRFEQLSCKEVTPLDPKSDEYTRLKSYLHSTQGHTHGIRPRLQDIFRIEREGENSRFEASEYANRADKNRRLLWHGSRTTNFAGILSQGLRIAPPEAPVNGYMFGKGVYLADMSTKSANYCMSSASGNHGLLLLCEAELGNPMHELIHADSGAAEGCKKIGKIATLGVGQSIPGGWVDAGSIHPNLKGVLMPDANSKVKAQDVHKIANLQYNEYICYDVKQIRMRYLLRFTT